MNELGLMFTANYRSSEINFLDLVLIGKIGETVKTHTYRKQTTGNPILHASSGHPQYVVNNIPSGEIVRARRHCSDKAFFEEEKKTHWWQTKNGETTQIGQQRYCCSYTKRSFTNEVKKRQK